MDALPELFIEHFGEVGSESEHCWLVWHGFVPTLEACDVVKPMKELCGGRVRLVRFSRPQSDLCQYLWEKFKLLAGGKAEISETEAIREMEHEVARVADSARRINQTAMAAKLLAVQKPFLAQGKATSGLQHV